MTAFLVGQFAPHVGEIVDIAFDDL